MTVSAKSLDEIDRRLIAALSADARQPLVALARTIGLSRSAAQERLRRLERAGVIAGYTVRLAEKPPAGVQAWLSITFRPGFKCADVMPALRPMPEIRLCHSLAGPVDMLALAETASVSDLAALRERVAALRGVAAVETALILATQLDRT